MALTTIDDRGLKTPIDLLDNEKIRFGTGNDLEIYHNGNHSYIVDTGTGNLAIGASILAIHSPGFSETMALYSENGAVLLYYDNVKKFETTSDGAKVTGDFTATGNGGGADFFWDSSADQLTLTDSRKIRFGDSGDLEIYHSGSHSFIKNTTGTLQLENAGNITITKGGTENMARFVPDGAVELYYDNVKTFETTTDGVTVKGSEGGNAFLYVSADEGDDNADKWRHIATVGGQYFLSNYASGGWEHNIGFTGNGSTELYYDNVKKFETTSYGSAHTGIMRFENSGDGISLYDSRELKLGSGDDLKIYHDGTLNIIDAASGNLEIRHGAEKMIACANDGQVELYYDNSKKFETTTSGATITGNLVLEDNYKISLGTSDDYKIYHTGTNSYLINDTGWLAILADNIAIKDKDDGDTFLTCNHDASVQLYYDGTQKFRTETDGVRILGDSKIWFDAWQGRLDRNWEDYPSITITPSTTYGNQGEFRLHGQSGSLGGYGSGSDFSIDMRVDGSYETGSDRRRKSNIEDITGALATVKQLTGKKFNIINRQGDLDPIKGTKKQFGLIAQECKDIIPEVVNFHPDEDTPNENGWASAYGLDYGQLTPLLINAIKELSAKVEALETEVAALKAK